ncbi:hypothetical protein [Legionella birminghamensis]|uniref:hypothetical protein n=1 Tax=Legionella birminghamensis TaxID=28083 RepID=UPI0007305E42|nr:hypothetical protein [Legionella birminghamensis]
MFKKLGLIAFQSLFFGKIENSLGSLFHLGMGPAVEAAGIRRMSPPRDSGREDSYYGLSAVNVLQAE